MVCGGRVNCVVHCKQMAALRQATANPRPRAAVAGLRRCRSGPAAARTRSCSERDEIFSSAAALSWS